MARPDGARRGKARRHQVLVVEREAAICSFIQTVLEDIGMAVSCAPGAIEAGKLARRRHFDVAYVAVMLPDGEGVALAEELAARDVAVMLMSGHPEGIARGQASRFPFLTKPFRAKDVLRFAIGATSDGPSA